MERKRDREKERANYHSITASLFLSISRSLFLSLFLNDGDRRERQLALWEMQLVSD